jgi:hypothetical protein
VKVAVVLTVLAACSFDHGEVPGPSTDADTDGIACTSFSTQVDTCALTGDQDLTLTGTNTYDTTMGTLNAGTTPVAITRMRLVGNAGQLETLIVHDFHMAANAQLRAVGNAPLAIVAFGTITLDGSSLIDATAGGAGARPTCAGAAVAGSPSGDGGGGGGGGAFAAAGGNGGNGNADGSAVPGGPGGNAEPTPAGPLGGCSGAKGGNGDDAGGAGGAGGGAIYLVSASRIDLAAGSGINVGGGGGGGGGGGCGGMILLEARVVRSMGMLAANGGGGGEASGDGDSGNPGNTGLLGPGAAPGGRDHSPTGTDGANGGAQASTPGASVLDSLAGGGGGGGGGVGYIVIVSPDKVVAMASPAAL